MFLHGNWQHLFWNVFSQLLAGVLLETGQGKFGTLRVAGIYIIGIVVGGLGAGVIEQEKLLGSSPGTYALLTAHLGIF